MGITGKLVHLYSLFATTLPDSLAIVVQASLGLEYEMAPKKLPRPLPPTELPPPNVEFCRRVADMPWPAAFAPTTNPPPRQWFTCMLWRFCVKRVLARHHNNVMTNALAHIVHARARAAVVVQHQLTLAITDLPFAEEVYRHIPRAICNYLGWPE